jgi:hypothetical protein
MSKRQCGFGLKNANTTLSSTISDGSEKVLFHPKRAIWAPSPYLAGIFDECWACAPHGQGSQGRSFIPPNKVRERCRLVLCQHGGGSRRSRRDP